MHYTLQSYLTSHGVIQTEDLAAYRTGRTNGQTLTRFLLQEKRASEKDLLAAYAHVLDLPVQDSIADDAIQPGLVNDLSIHFLKAHTLLPLRLEGDTATVVLSDPLDILALDQLRILLKVRRIDSVLAPSEAVLSAVNRAFGHVQNGAEHIIQGLDAEDSESFFNEFDEEISADLLDETSEAPVIKLVNHILSQAVHYKASDIHIEPYQQELKIRFRMDGVLYDILTLPKKLHPAVVSRVKILASLNIAEKRIPQDGRINIRIGDREVDLRVSSLPTAFGERLVLRLLEKDVRVLNLQEIGMSREHLDIFEKLIRISHGIILVTGPTGSGKTTTLYSALTQINTPDKNILTIEDPIEYQLDGIGQMQVNSRIGLTFANGLRSMVRQDPDVILVGEIRDLETAEIAIQAALTGHLVFSTLHTNDSSGAITRLIDMGIEPFLVSSSVHAILAQRLVRRLCPNCKQSYAPAELELKELGPGAKGLEGRFFKPVGCEACLQTGYKGRTGIFEFLRVSEAIQSLVLHTSESNQIRQLAVKEGMRTLRQDGVRKVLAGETSIDEVLRVTQV
ncbi:type II secretion system ATPase GspE [Desulfovermiculus halophilus]|jgi:general secretion pathway protein E|uniref:type II secretion system ATPase GspE n=1 Tax=Desulfovermiculus halophilus TaxID=339722 RepID=UPI0009FF0A7D|nr:type II secretion system ATPase GspE [Desulfovermiculus halophilus]